MRTFIFISALILSSSLFASSGRMHVKINIPPGVYINSFHAQYSRGGLDFCGTPARVQGTFSIKNNVLTGSVRLKETIRDQSCRKKLESVELGFGIFNKFDDLMIFDGSFYGNPLSTPSPFYRYTFQIPVKKNVPPMNGKGFSLDCTKRTNDDYVWKTWSCKHDAIPAVSLHGNNFLNITSIKPRTLELPSDAPAISHELSDLGFGLEAHSNQDGVIGKDSFIRIYQLPGPLKSALPTGFYLVSQLYPSSQRYMVTFGAVEKATGIAYEIDVDLIKLASHQTIRKCELAPENCRWSLLITSFDKKSRSTTTRYLIR